MEDLRKFTKQQIIDRARQYEVKMRELQEDTKQYLSGKRKDEKRLLRRYHDLRKEMARESKYLETRCEIYRISDVHEAYQNGMYDCRRNGFAHVTEHEVSYRIVSILEHAVYRLTSELIYIGVYK